MERAEASVEQWNNVPERAAAAAGCAEKLLLISSLKYASGKEPNFFEIGEL